MSMRRASAHADGATAPQLERRSMMRKSLLVLGAATALTCFLTLHTDGAAVSPDRLTSAVLAPGIRQEPILNFDVSGSTLTGPFHSRLTVYNSGLITASQCSGFTGGNSAGTGYAAPAQVEKLRRELIDAGGLVLPDQNLSVADIPLTTVTVFNGGTNAKAHTFSYWVGIKGYGQIAQIISDFSLAHTTSCQGIFSD